MTIKWLKAEGVLKGGQRRRMAICELAGVSAVYDVYTL